MSNYVNAEIVNEENVAQVIDIVEKAANSPNKGIATIAKIGMGVLGVTTIVVGSVFGVKAIKKHKSKQELNQPDEGTVIEPTDEQIAEVVGQ